MNKEEKKDKKIEDWKMEYNHWCQLAIDRKRELEKKDKIIDKMAEEINKTTSEKYKIKHICEKGKCIYEECHEDDWNECIKQYFERKVENGN
ncbi:MAG: hypothetical protein ACI4VH_06900 [Clostridia bacterium]